MTDLHMDELVDLLRRTRLRPESAAYLEYRERIHGLARELSREAFAALVLELFGLSMAQEVPAHLALYPLVKEFVTRFGESPELLIVLHNFAPEVHDEESVGEYLRRAYALDPNNRYVLWALLISHGAPWFPKELVGSRRPLEFHRWIVERLLETNPDDALALGVQERLRRTDKDLFAPENRGFRNYLAWLAPDPLGQGDFPRLLRK